MKMMMLAAALALGFSQAAAAETLRTNGVEIEYRVMGAGEPLLMLHGFGECIDQSWGAIAPRTLAACRGYARATA